MFYRGLSVATTCLTPRQVSSEISRSLAGKKPFSISMESDAPRFFSGWRSADQGRQLAFPPAVVPTSGSMALLR